MSLLVAGLPDLLLSPLLLLPPGVGPVVLGALTALAVALLRRRLWHADDATRYANDRRRLRELIRDARQKRDRETVRRLRKLQAVEAGMALRREILPVLLSVPLVLCAVSWARERLAYLSPGPNEPIAIELRTAKAGATGVAHIVPIPGVACEPGWVVPLADTGTGNGLLAGHWILRLPGRPVPYRIDVRSAEEDLSLTLAIGNRKRSGYESAASDGAGRLWARLQPTPLFGFLPPLHLLGMPSWLVGYLVAALVVTLALRRVPGFP